MTDTDDAIPAGMISLRDMFDTEYQTITPGWQTLEERLDPNSLYYDRFKGPKKSAKKKSATKRRKRLTKEPKKNPKDDAVREAWRAYYQAQLHASGVFRQKLSQGTRVAQCGKKKKAEQLSPDRWASMSDFEAMLIFNDGKAIVRGKRRTLWLDPKNHAPPDNEKTSHPGKRGPTTAQKRSQLRSQRIREIHDQLRPGFEGLQKELYDAIRGKCPWRPSDKTIERALKSD
jgi:hypothetical protein